MGVNSEDYWAFRPGERVRVVEGFVGVVDEVQDGPYPGTEIYIVSLDNGMGGGQYGSGELSRARDSEVTSNSHTAADDYPELGTILLDRPNHKTVMTAASLHAQARQESNASLDEEESALQPCDHYEAHPSMSHTCKHCLWAWGAHSATAGGPTGHGSDTLHPTGAKDETYLMPPDFETEVTVDEDGNRHIVGSEGGLCPPCSGQDESAPHTCPPMVAESAVYEDNPEADAILDQAAELITQANELRLVEAGWLTDKMLDHVVDHAPAAYSEPVQAFDWCRFRRPVGPDGHCWYAKSLNESATKTMGYAVWIPEDRGTCVRVSQEQQKQCPIGEPGPHIPGGFLDATVPFEQGGQHYSTVAPEFGWHATAAWRDVQAKAKALAADGRVHIIGVPAGNSITISANVQGDNDVYRTVITRVPGKYAVAMWECGCAWSSYSWGRTGRWKRFEGRMCSHALAVTYEAQRREMFGADMHADTSRPSWWDATQLPKTVYDKVKQRSLAGLTSVATLQRGDWEVTADLVDPPVTEMAAAMLEAGGTATQTYAFIRATGAKDPDTIIATALKHPFLVKVRNQVLQVVDMFDNALHLSNGDVVSPAMVYYPTYDPHLGLSLSDHRHGARRGGFGTSSSVDDPHLGLSLSDRKHGAADPIVAYEYPHLGMTFCPSCEKTNGSEDGVQVRRRSHYDSHDVAVCSDCGKTIRRGKNAALDSDPCPACSGTGEQGTGHECYSCDGSGEADAYDPSIDNANPANGLLVGRNDAAGIAPVLQSMAIRVHHDPETGAVEIIGAPKKERLGKCYELSSQHAIFGKDGPRPENGFAKRHDTTLVHGTIQGEDLPPIGHAWVEEGDRVWEPASDQSYSREGFKALFHPQEHARYSADEAAVNMLKHKHYGPWHDIETTSKTASSHQTYYVHRDSAGTALVRHTYDGNASTFHYYDRGRKDWVEDNSWAKIPIKGSSGAVQVSPEEAESVRAQMEHEGAPPANKTSMVTDAQHPEAKAHGERLEQAYLGVEPRITPLVRGVAKRLGGDTRGLRFRIKGFIERGPNGDQDGLVRDGRTIASKIERVMRSKGVDAQRAAGSINDALRYTVTFPEDRYAEGVDELLSALKAEGHSPALGQAKNYWKQGDPYDGINITMNGPGGIKWELQAHTPKSFAVKQRNHKDYEDYEKEADPAKRKTLYDRMSSRSAAIPRPPGARDISRHLFRDIFDTGPELAHAAAKDDGPTVSGVVLKAKDTGRVLMLQRGLDDPKDPAAGTWEFPGGHHEEGDLTSLHAGIREWQEEVGKHFPEGGVVTHTWRSPNGKYQGHVVVIPEEKAVRLHEGRDLDNPDDPDGDMSEQVAWWDIDHARKNPALREECKVSPWNEFKKAAVLDGEPTVALMTYAVYDDEVYLRCDSCGHEVDNHDMRTGDATHYPDEPCPSCGHGTLRKTSEAHPPVDCPAPEHHDGDGLNPAIWDEGNGYQHHDGSVSHNESDRSVSDWISNPHEGVLTREALHSAIAKVRSATYQPAPHFLTVEDLAPYMPADGRQALNAAYRDQGDEWLFESGGPLEHVAAATVDAEWLNGKADIIATMLGMPRERLQPIVDDVVARHGLASVTAMTAQEFAERVMADLHDSPEPALPQTDGIEEPDSYPAPSVPVEQGEHPVPPDPIKEFQAKATHLAPNGPQGSAQGGDNTYNGESIASVAQRFLKEGLKAFTPGERKQIIDEGMDVIAGNFDALDLEGTHYMSLEQALQSQDAAKELWT